MTVRKSLLVLLSMLMAVALLFTVGCGGGAEEPAAPAEEPAAEEPAAEAPAFDEGAAIIKVTDDWWSSELSKVWIINAVDLNEQLFVNKDEAMQVLDIREPADFAKGHIEGALNIPFSSFADEATLAQLDDTKTFIVADADGQNAPAIYLYLTQLGYDAMLLRFGMSGWTTDEALGTVWDGVGIDAPTTTAPTLAQGSFEIPSPSTGATNEREALVNGIKNYFANGGADLMTAAELKAMLDSGADDFQVVSVRAPEHYEIGHLDGAINIPMAQMAKAESLSKLDPSKKVVVYCYQGHASAQVQLLLSQLGYDVVGLQYGMSAWTNDADVRAS